MFITKTPPLHKCIIISTRNEFLTIFILILNYLLEKPIHNIIQYVGIDL